MVRLESAMTEKIQFPAMRDEVLVALDELSRSEGQRDRWSGRVPPQPRYHGNLTMFIHTLYDDCEVVPDPWFAVPGVLYRAEVPAFRYLGSVLGPIIDVLGDSPDDAYLDDARWPSVVDAATKALEVMRRRRR